MTVLNRLFNRFSIASTALAQIWGLGRVKVFRFHNEIYPRRFVRYGKNRPAWWGGPEFELTVSWGRWLFAFAQGRRYVRDKATGQWWTGENQVSVTDDLFNRTKSRWSKDASLAARARLGQYPLNTANDSLHTLHRFHPAGWLGTEGVAWLQALRWVVYLFVAMGVAYLVARALLGPLTGLMEGLSLAGVGVLLTTEDEDYLECDDCGDDIIPGDEERRGRGEDILCGECAEGRDEGAAMCDLETRSERRQLYGGMY